MTVFLSILYYTDLLNRWHTQVRRLLVSSRIALCPHTGILMALADMLYYKGNSTPYAIDRTNIA